MAFDFSASYDALNPSDLDHRFYAGLAARRGLRRVVDLGCGTGNLAVMLARAGHEVVAIDPDPEMLRVARGRPGHDLVSWLQGGAELMPSGWADLVTMSGHTAQVFTTHDTWCNALLEVHRGLAPDGVLAFETRNPDARSWERWTRQQTMRVVDTEEGPVEFWHDTIEVDLPLVTYATCTANFRTGDRTTYTDTLAFPDEESVHVTLAAMGFGVEGIVGDWDGGPVSATNPELVVIAHRMDQRPVDSRRSGDGSGA